jgi:hypothetical protein
MTKQDYDLIVQAIDDTRIAIWQKSGQKARLEADDTLRKFIYRFSVLAENSNPEFNRIKFRKSCGLSI